jgi:hypothetical protein
MESRIRNWLGGATSGIRWLQKGGGRGLLHEMASIFDDALGRAVASVKESMLLECSDSSLDYHARNSNDRRVTGESDAQLRAYLANRWPRHKEAGTEDALHFQLTRLGYPNHELWSYQRLKLAGVPSGTAFGGPSNLGFFFVVIRQPHPFADAPLWDGGGDYNDGQLWGGDATNLARLSELEFTLHRWRPSGRSPRFVVIDLDGSTVVRTAAPYDFDGNYLRYPFFEASERFKSPLQPYYNSSFVNP